METNAMEVKNLSFSYGSNQILSDISLTIPRGKITTIMGANGCGKSTLFSLMTKNLTPGKGKILLEEKSIKKYSLSEFARKVSIVHQHNSAAEDITIERLVSYGRTPYQKMLGGKSEEDERLIEQALQVTGLLDLRDREIGRLSGGQRQRVWIAMALAQNTELLFLDEPTIGLDAVSKLQLRDFLLSENHAHGTTIMLTTHDMEDISALCRRVLVLGHGKKLFDGELPALLARYDTMRTLRVRYAGEITLSALPEGVQISRDGDFYVLAYPQQQVPTDHILSLLQSAGPIAELTLHERSMDRMIADMYQEMAL